MSLYNEILIFWFGKLRSPDFFPEKNSKTWFFKNPEFDAAIKSKFSYLFPLVTTGKLDHWLHTPRGKLAYIIVCDQFSRNVFRGSPEAFSYDSYALAISKKGLEDKTDLELYPIERSFFYLPLEHSEDINIQSLSVSCYEKLLDIAPQKDHSYYASNLKYAVDHKKIIERFHRFPHRNSILGRTSTQEEIDFLKLPGSSF